MAVDAHYRLAEDLSTGSARAATRPWVEEWLRAAAQGPGRGAGFELGINRFDPKGTSIGNHEVRRGSKN